ncbi:uncharacterized protein ACB057_012358 [Neosynchiropus ocellatus]
MMRTDSKGRSGSPHRITYNSDFHAIKCSFDMAQQPATKPASTPQLLGQKTSVSDAVPSITSSCGSSPHRGRMHSTRGTKIRDNIFLQMDNQQLGPDGGARLSSGSSPSSLISSQTSPFSASKRPCVNSSSVQSAVASICAQEPNQQEKPARSEDIRDIDRAALAQKFSVTRKLFESKFSQVGGRGLVCKTSRQSKAEEGLDDRSMNPPTVNIFSPKPHTVSSCSESLMSELPSEAPLTFQSCQQDTERQPENEVEEDVRSDVATLDPCLITGHTVRAELVTVENGSSESDENEEGEQQEERYMEVIERVRDLVDDVFEDGSDGTAGGETSTEGEVPALAAGVAHSEERVEKFSACKPCKNQRSDEEEGGDKYKQVNERREREEQNTQSQSPEDVKTMGGDGSLNQEDRVMRVEDKNIVSGAKLADMEGEYVDCCLDGTKGKNDQAGDLSEITKESSLLPPGNHLMYEEIPGLPKIADPEDGKARSRMVWFSSAPIKVFSTYSNADYDRHNEDIDPVSASAEYELEKRVDRMDVFPVEIEKGEEGLGISIIGMGVGADQGLEKLGIFVKTVTGGGATEKDGRILVNDQIVEVDGVSLVGVSQLFAATVLKNTSGLVKFLIGREKDGVESEVGRLINESLEMEKTSKEKERSRRQREPGDELMAEEEEEEDLPSLSTLDKNQLCVRYQQLWSKLRCRTTQLQQSREKLMALEERQSSWENEKAELEQRLEDEEEKSEKLEKYWQEAQTLCRVVSQRLADAQSQSESLEIKYSKAKRLVRELQSREEEWEKKGKDLRRELEEKDVKHQEAVKKLQMQREGKQPGGQVKDHSEEEVSDWYIPVPDTRRLDSSAQIARAQLAQKSKRHPPSREKLRESFRRQQEDAEKAQEKQALAAPAVLRGSKSDRSSTSSFSTLSPHLLTNSFSTPPIYITDAVPPSTCKSSSRKSKRKFPDFSGIRKSLSKRRSEKHGRRSMSSRGSCGDLIDEPTGISPTASITSMPSCLPFPWFGERGREKEDSEACRERLRSVSSSSLPYLTTTGRRDPSTGSLKDSSSMVRHLSDHSLSGHSYTFTFSSTETLDDDPAPTNNNHQWQSRPVLEWNVQQVCLWLYAMNMDQYSAEFATRGVDGSQLLNMDNEKLKALGVSSQLDRSALKKKLKEMRKSEDKRVKEKRQKEKKLILEKEDERKEKLKRTAENLETGTRSSVRTARTESLL